LINRLTIPAILLPEVIKEGMIIKIRNGQKSGKLSRSLFSGIMSLLKRNRNISVVQSSTEQRGELVFDSLIAFLNGKNIQYGMAEHVIV